MDKLKARFAKMKEVFFCILNGYLYWKDLSGILLHCLLENEEEKTIKEFYKGVCGGHHFWKGTINKILRARFYGPTI